MGSFIFYCPHCNGKLEVDSSWIGLSTQCPSCGRKISFSPPEAPDPPTSSAQPEPPGDATPVSDLTRSGNIELVPVKEADKTKTTSGQDAKASRDLADFQVGKSAIISSSPRAANETDPSEGGFRGVGISIGGGHYYRFGRLFIMLAWLLATGILFLTLIASVIDYRDYRATVRKLPEQYEWNDRQQDLLRIQKNLFAEFVVLTERLSGPDSVFQLPAEDCRQPDTFGTIYENEADVAAARKILETYQARVTAIKTSFSNYFQPLQSLLQRETVGQQTTAATPRIVLQADSAMPEFYADAARQQGLAQQFQQVLESAARNDATLSPAVREECGKLATGVQFIQQHLFTRQSNVTVIAGKGASETDAGTASANTLAAALYQAVTASEKELSRNWQIDGTMAQLDTALQEAERVLRRMNEEQATLSRKCLGGVMGEWLTGLLAALLVMVGADFLRAHLDTAELLRGIYKKT